MVAMKKDINYIRNSLKRLIIKNKELLSQNNEKLEYLNSYKDKPAEVIHIVKGKNYQHVSRENAQSVLSTMIDDIEKNNIEIKKDNGQIQSLIDALSVSGMKKVTYRLPVLSLGSLEIGSVSSYLILTGIKLNGAEEKDNLDLMDDIEIKLHEYEQKMAVFIEEDFSVNEESYFEFMDLYRQYIDLFLNNCVKKEDFPELLYYFIFSSMSFYLLSQKDSSIEKEEEYKKDVVSSTKENILLEKYIVDGRVVELCDTKTFTRLLEEANLPSYLKEEYLKQMNNLFGRKHEEKLNEKKKLVRKSILDEQELYYYELAKKSGKIEATQIVKEIDAIVELLLDVKNEQDKNDLILECKTYIGYLKEIFAPNEVVAEEAGLSILYYKNAEEIPLLLDEILKDKSGSYKTIYTNFNKLINGNTSGDREVLGTGLSYPIYYKGRDFKIFYMMIQDVLVIINGMSGENAFQRIQNIVQSKQFLTYFKDICSNIASKKISGETQFTTSILKELESSKAVQKMLCKS